MSDFDFIRLADAARRNSEFTKAESILADALGTAEAPESRETILQQLFFVYADPRFKHLEKAERCLQQIEELSPSAQSALRWVYFNQYCKKAPLDAERWAKVTTQRAENEGETETLYTAISLEGLFAAKRGDSSGAQDALRRLKLLVQKSVPVRYGDEVGFLEESLALDEEMRKEAAAFARVIATRIEDPAFRSRAESIAGSVL